MRRPMIFFATLVLLLTPGAARADTERILRFDSEITVHEDASMTVKETIRVHAQGQQIRHGIYRDFPTRYRDRYGNAVVIDFDIQETARDGRPEPYHTEDRSNGVRAYLGSPSVLLSPGDYTYVLTYRTNRQLGFFADHDELYWNVTGNDWAYPIEHAAATVLLPGRVDPGSLRLEAYTGLAGEKGKDYRSTAHTPSRAEFSSTHTLDSQEGLTIVVGWPKGVVHEPTLSEKVEWFFRDNRFALAGLTGLTVLTVYYVLVWIRVGRDPPPGTIIPRFAPPAGFSPSAIRYLRRMEFDDRTFASALIHMAVRGILSIKHRSGRYQLIRTPGDPAKLGSEDLAVVSRLFDDREKLDVRDTHHEKFSGGQEALETALAEKMRPDFFVTNTVFLLGGIALSILAAGWPILMVQNHAGSTPVLGIVLIVSIALGLDVLFGHLLKAPKPAGRNLLDRVEGFRMYLEAAERDELNFRNPPERTPELFEKYLPYALALDVEQAWSQKFSGILARAAVGPGTTYAPTWYDGPEWSSSRCDRFVSSLGDSMSSAIEAASTPPGSSSGFSGGGGGGGGGGGSSGGGGGGGGGGGW